MKKLADKFGRKRLVIAGGVIGILMAAAVVCGIIFFRSGSPYKQTDGSMPQMTGMKENVITASGLTAAGMVEEKYELDFLETALYVEESYLSLGDTVEAGEAVFKVSDETLRKAQDELERAATEAELQYRQGIISYHTQKLEAESTLAQAQINKEYAQAEYDSALEEAKEEVNTLTQQVEEAKELYDEYKAAAENDYYYTYYRVDELKQIYYENFAYLMELYEKWNIDELEDQYPNAGSSNTGSGNTGSGTVQAGADSRMESGQSETVFMTLSLAMEDQNKEEQEMSAGLPEMSGGKAGGSFYDENSGKLSVYQMMDELVQKNGEEYETALENYEKDTKMAIASLEAAESQLAKLQAELEEAQLDYDKQVITQKAAYETTLAESENAELVYNTEIKKLDEELEGLKDEKEETEDNLALFDEIIGDGLFYTTCAGTVVMNMVRAGNILSGESILLAYSNPDIVTVEASVSQDDIAQISVGDSAYVVISGYDDYEGTVTAINPVSASDSRSSVTYTVTVELSGGAGELESNLTAYVYFGMTEGIRRNE